MNQKLKILITGATGFIGQHLLEDLDADKYIISIITRDKSKPIRYLPHHCNIFEADLLDVESLKVAMKNQDVLINLAAEVRDNYKLFSTNISGTKNLIEAIKLSEIKHIIHLSSVGVVGKSYNSSILNVDETTICTPQNEYERTKHISEQLLFETFGKINSFNLCILRPTNVYGEFHPFNALLRMINHIQSGKILALKKNAIVNYVYVKDITSFICKTIENPIETGVYNIGEAETLESFFKTISKLLKLKLKLILIPLIIVRFAQFLGLKKLNPISNCIIYSDNKLKSSFTYPYGNLEGLNRTIIHYRKLKLLK